MVIYYGVWKKRIEGRERKINYSVWCWSMIIWFSILLKQKGIIFNCPRHLTVININLKSVDTIIVNSLNKNKMNKEKKFRSLKKGFWCEIWMRFIFKFNERNEYLILCEMYKKTINIFKWMNICKFLSYAWIFFIV